MSGSIGDLYKIGWELTAQLGLLKVHWKVEDSDLEVWAGERYFVVCQTEPETFIVTEEKEEDPNFLEGRKVWHDWTDAAHDMLDRIMGPR